MPTTPLYRRCRNCNTPKVRQTSHCDSPACPWCITCAGRTSDHDRRRFE